ncbi:MAG: S-layer homology domain-containing protein [Lawsonibacter sp.]|nr:S-layer homology domain-containing protein [Lawsonibacter sp.]
MRNLKRALSLTLASVMLLGMMVISTGAASFNDADEIQNIEAAEVLNTIGVMKGDGENFMPGQTVTRGQMAILVCQILYGDKLNVNQFADYSQYTDVPANEYYTGYVNLASNLGIISGYGNGQFGPGDPVTTAQAALMLCKALGYFQGKELVGDWGTDALTAITQATKLKLFGKLKLATNDGLKRDDVAEMVFNTLTKAVPVDYNTNFDIYYSDSTAWTNGVTFRYIDTLGYENFDLVYDNSANVRDDYGRPAKNWGVGRYNGNGMDEKGDLKPGAATLLDINAVVTIADEPNLTYTTGVSGKNLATAVGNTAMGYDWSVHNNGASVTGVGVTDTGDKPIRTDGDNDYGLTGRGVRTEIFIRSDLPTAAVEVVYTNYYLAQITRTGSDGDGRYVTVALENSVSVKNRNYHTNDFAADDYVIVSVARDEKGDSYIASMTAAESVEGKVTAYSTAEGTGGARYITLDGQKYDTSYNNAKDIDRSGAVDFTDYRLYLDQYGYVVGYEQTGNAVGSYLYVTDQSVDDVLGDYRARVVFPDGTTEAITIKGNEGIKAKPTRNTVYRYEVQKNNEYVLYASSVDSSYTIDNSQTGTVENSSSRIALSPNGRLTVDLNTKFVHVNNTTRSYNSYVGYNAVPDITQTDLKTVDHNKDGIIDIVYVIGGSASNADSKIFYVASTGANNWGSIQKDNTTYYEFRAAYVDGEQETIVVNQAVRDLISTNGKGAYKVLSTNSDGYITALDGSAADPFKADGIVTKGEMNVVATGVGNNAFKLQNGDSYTFDRDTIFVYVDGDDVEKRDERAIITNEKNATDATGVFVAKCDTSKNDLAKLVFVVAMSNTVPAGSDSAALNEALGGEETNVKVVSPEIDEELTVPTGKTLTVGGTITGDAAITTADETAKVVFENATFAGDTDLSGVENLELSGSVAVAEGASLKLPGGAKLKDNLSVEGDLELTENVSISAGKSIVLNGGKVKLDPADGKTLNLPKLTGNGTVEVPSDKTVTTPGEPSDAEGYLNNLKSQINVPVVAGVKEDGAGKKATFAINASNIVGFMGGGKVESWSSTLTIAGAAARTGGDANSKVVFVELKLPANVFGTEKQVSVTYTTSEVSDGKYNANGDEAVKWSLSEGECAGTTTIIIPVTDDVTSIILTEVAGDI